MSNHRGRVDLSRFGYVPGSFGTEAEGYVEYKDFLLHKESYYNHSVWSVGNPLTRRVGVFDGRGALLKAKKWIDDLSESKRKELLTREKEFGFGAFREDEIRPQYALDRYKQFLASMEEKVLQGETKRFPMRGN